METLFFDTHAHICHPKLWEHRQEVIHHAETVGVGGILCVGYDIESSRKSLQLAKNNSHVYAAVGISPHDAKTASEEDWKELEDLLQHPKVIACGETGLDYHYMHSPREIQMKAFRKHLQMACGTGKPVVIHLRDSADDLFSLIDAEGLPESGGILHCFTADEETAQKGLDRGLYISFSGIVTFAKDSALVKVVETIDMARMLIETDCPYLAPIPHRGLTCEPSMLPETAKKIAQLRGISVSEVAKQTRRNAINLFGLDT